MKDREIEQLIADDKLLTKETMEKVDRKEYTFIKKYITSQNDDVRNNALTFCTLISQEWCLPHFFQCLNDPIIAHRSIAAQGILKLSPENKKTEIYNAISVLYNNSEKDNQSAISYCILTIGNIGDKNDITLLEKLRDQFSKIDILESAYQQSLAKLGHEKSITQIKEELKLGKPEDKIKALQKVSYINIPSWIEDVKPLLLDTTIAISIQMGRGSFRINKKVCDYAINTLIIIDPDKKITFDPMTHKPFTDEQIKDVQTLYFKSNNETE